MNKNNTICKLTEILKRIHKNIDIWNVYVFFFLLFFLFLLRRKTLDAKRSVWVFQPSTATIDCQCEASLSKLKLTQGSRQITALESRTRRNSFQKHNPAIWPVSVTGEEGVGSRSLGNTAACYTIYSILFKLCAVSKSLLSCLLVQFGFLFGARSSRSTSV